MVVIARDSLNRDYHPEKLITVGISQSQAELIAYILNIQNDGYFYVVVEDEYQLDLQSMLDVINATDKDYKELAIRQLGKVKALEHKYLNY